MPNLKEYFYKETNNLKTNQYIETGSFHGDGIARVLPNYKQVHSIELAEGLYNRCVKRFKDESKVHMHLGNSKYILPEILKNINEPATVYLDGHFSAGETAFGDDIINGLPANPLLGELEALMKREYNDIIIIDDCRFIGTKGWCNKGQKGGNWPEFEYDWTNITEEKIVALLKPGYVLLKNSRHVYTDGPGDQWVLAFKQ